MKLKTIQFTESMNKPYKYSWQKFTDLRASGAFVLSNKDWVDLEINIHHTLSSQVIADVVFSRSSEETVEDFSINNKGDAFRIFATVMKMVNEFVKKFGAGINAITFTAEKKDDTKGSRAKLYDRMSKKFVPKGWEYQKEAPGSGGKSVRFKFVNKNFDPEKSPIKFKI